MIEGFRIHQGAGQFKFSGVDSPESAKTLSGIGNYGSQRDAAALDEADEWYIADLIGLRVLDADGNQPGRGDIDRYLHPMTFWKWKPRKARSSWFRSEKSLSVNRILKEALWFSRLCG